jgi:organic radical activating enzyme
MQIIEHFYTLQGEGKRIGVPSYFIRLGGCMLNCAFCDSKFSWKYNSNLEGNTQINTLDDFKKFFRYNKKIRKSNEVVITGGEPLWDKNQPILKEVVHFLLDKQYYITFETTMLTNYQDIFETTAINNSVKLLRLFDVNRSHIGGIKFSISPKINLDSYNKNFKGLTFDNICKFYTQIPVPDYFTEEGSAMKHMYYKFVYEPDKENELNLMLKHIYKSDSNIYIMPCTPFPYTEEKNHEIMIKCAEYCKKYRLRFSPRAHIDIWGPHVRGV